METTGTTPVSTALRITIVITITVEDEQDLNRDSDFFGTIATDALGDDVTVTSVDVEGGTLILVVDVPSTTSVNGELDPSTKQDMEDNLKDELDENGIEAAVQVREADSTPAGKRVRTPACVDPP